jgi:ACS family hexuronate transporter-like MFS transporter
MKIPHLRWLIAGLLFTATVIKVQYAGILQGFLYAYTIMYLVSGILVDRWGTRAALAVFMVWWSLAGILHALAHTAGQFFFVRVLLGIGEPGNFIAGSRVVSEWYPARERAFVNGLGVSVWQTALALTTEALHI